MPTPSSTPEDNRIIKWYDRTIGFFFWWIIYHGNENPLKLYKEARKLGTIK